MHGGIDREFLQQRSAQFGQRIEHAIDDTTEARHGYRAAAAGARHRVALRARRAVEDRTEPVVGGLDGGEFFESCCERRKFRGVEARQRIAWPAGAERLCQTVGVGTRDLLCVADLRRQDDSARDGCRKHATTRSEYILVH